MRLGENVFLRHRFSEDIFKKGAKAFQHFKEVMEEFGVTKYRAVATSASREAQNRKQFTREIRKKSGIALEVISSNEESRLGREAAFAALGPESPPRCVIDLGGGSLEISILRDHKVESSVQIPAGTVRLMSTLNIPGTIKPAQADQVRKYVRALLESRLPSRPNLGESCAVALGGNAETLAAIAPGPRQHGVMTLELSLLRERLSGILERDVRERMKILRRPPRSRRRNGHRRAHLRHAGPLPQSPHASPFPPSASAKASSRKSPAKPSPANNRIATTPPPANSWSAPAASPAAWTTTSATPNTSEN